VPEPLATVGKVTGCRLD